MKLPVTKAALSFLLSAIIAVSFCACETEKGKTEPESSVASEKSLTETSDDDTEESKPVKSENSAESSVKKESDTVSEENSNRTTSDYPERWNDNGIFSYYYADAYKKMQTMTTEEKIGQMLLVRCPEYDADKAAKRYSPGGYVLFGRDFQFKTKDEVKNNIRSYQDSSKIPMIIAVDEEGGTVIRVSRNSELADQPFRSPRELFEAGGMDAIKKDTEKKSEILRELGINTNLAPVCDISRSPDDFMYDRSIGQSADITADFARTVTQVSQENCISAALKHFPGYGSNLDTHTGLAYDDRTVETFRKNDFVPFRAGIEAGAHFVLVSHNIIKNIDGMNPASISPMIHEILRNELGFTGLIITDDMAMEGVGAYLDKDYSPEVAAVIAGNDMLIVSDAEYTINEIRNGLEENYIHPDSIDKAVMHILAMKYATGLLKD